MFIHSFACLRREPEDLHSWTNCLNVAVRRMPIEFYRAGQVHLRNYRYVGTVENCWILQRLILALGHGNEDEPQILTEVIRRRTDQISNILNEEEIQTVEIPSFQRVLDHDSFEMT